MKKTAFRFFCVAYGGAHIQMLKPVIERLKALGHETVVLALTAAQTALDKTDIKYIGFADLVIPEDEGALQVGRRLACDLPTPPINWLETAAYLGLSYQDLEERLGRAEAASLYSQKGRQCFEPVSVLERALKKFKPDMVIVTSSPRAEKAAALAARHLNIPSVCLVDLFGRFTTWASDPAYTDKLLVFSNYTREHFIQQGRPDKDIVITGNPAMDRLSDPAWRLKGKQWRKEQGWSDKIIIFWASHAEPSPNQDLPAKIDEMAWQAVKQHEDWRLIVRFHPSEAPRELPDDPRIYISNKAEEITPLIYACDACLIINSTVGLEAALIEKPLVSVDLSVFTPDTPFADMGISQGAKSLDQIPTILADAVKRGPYQREGLKLIDNATEKVIATVLELISGH